MTSTDKSPKLFSVQKEEIRAGGFIKGQVGSYEILALNDSTGRPRKFPLQTPDNFF